MPEGKRHQGTSVDPLSGSHLAPRKKGMIFQQAMWLTRGEGSMASQQVP